MKCHLLLVCLFYSDVCSTIRTDADAIVFTKTNTGCRSLIYLRSNIIVFFVIAVIPKPNAYVVTAHRTLNVLPKPGLAYAIFYKILEHLGLHLLRYAVLDTYRARHIQ